MNTFNDTTVGKVTWESLKAELLKLDKDTLTEMINMAMKNYWSNQSYWMVNVEKDFGFEAAGDLDVRVWTNLARVQAGRLKKMFNLGGDVQALCTALKMTAIHWGFEWQFLSVEDKRLVAQVNKCPMGIYRESQGLELLPCKGGAVLYSALAQAINPKWDVICRHAHPDPRIKNVMCEWEFNLQE